VHVGCYVIQLQFVETAWERMGTSLDVQGEFGTPVGLGLCCCCHVSWNFLLYFYLPHKYVKTLCKFISSYTVHAT
jgi:hypothetical protein